MLVDGARGLNVGGVRMGVGVLKVGEGAVRLFVLEIGEGGRRWVVQARTGDLA